VLANKLGDYVVRLLDKVHGNAELNAILNAGDDDSDDPCRPHGELARLQLAIDCREKKVWVSDVARGSQGAFPPN